MQRTLSGIVLLALACSTANAALLSRSSGQAYYDDVLDITWIANANLADTTTFGVLGINANGTMTWAKSNEWIAAMNTAAYLGTSDWRLPTTAQPDATCASQFNPGGSFPLQGFGFSCTGSEMGHLFNVDGITSGSPTPFANVQPDLYWSGTEYAPDTGSAWHFEFLSGSQNVSNKANGFYAWAVRPGDIAPVPVPGAVWLFGGALALLGAVRRRAMTTLG